MKKKTLLVSALSVFLLALSACELTVPNSSQAPAPESSSAETSQTSSEASASQSAESSSGEASSSDSGPSSSETPPATQYTITFDANGGTGTMAAVTKNQGETYTLPACVFTKDGYHFDYWLVGNDATHRAVGYQFTVNGNVTVAAQWAQDEPEPGPEPGEKTLTSIDVVNTKAEYEVGDDFDEDSLTVTANYSDESQEVLAKDKYTVTGFDSSAVETIQELTVTVKDSTVSKKITISIVAPAKTLVSIDIVNTKTEYEVGESFVAESLTVTANYLDASYEVLAASAYEVTGFNSSVAVAYQQLTVTVKGTTVSKNTTISIVAPSTAHTAVVTGSTPTHNVYAFGWNNAEGIYLAEVTDFVSATHTYTFDFGSNTESVDEFLLFEVRESAPSSLTATYVSEHWSAVVYRQTTSNLTFAANEGEWGAVVSKVCVAPLGVWQNQVEYDLTYVEAKHAYVSDPIVLHATDLVYLVAENYYMHYGEFAEVLATPETYASFTEDGNHNLVVINEDAYTFYATLGAFNIVSETDLHRVNAKKNGTALAITDVKDPGSEYYAEYEIYLANEEYIEFFDKDDFALDLYYGENPATKKFTSTANRFYHFALTNDNKVYITDSVVTSKAVTVDEAITEGNSVKVWGWNNPETFGKVFDATYNAGTVSFNFGADYCNVDKFLIVEVKNGQTFDGSTWNDTIIAKQTYDYAKDASSCLWKKANNIYVNGVSSPLVVDTAHEGYVKSQTLTLYEDDVLYLHLHDGEGDHYLKYAQLDKDNTEDAVEAYFTHTDDEFLNFKVLQAGQYIFHANNTGVFIECVKAYQDYELYKLAYGSAVGGATSKWNWATADAGSHADIEEVGATGQVEFTLEVTEPVNMKVISMKGTYYGDKYAVSPFNNGDEVDDNIYLDVGTYSIYFKIYTDHYAFAIVRNTAGLSLYVNSQYVASKMPAQQVEGKYVFEVEGLEAGDVLSFSYAAYTKDTSMANNNLTDGMAIIAGGNLTITVDPTEHKVRVSGYTANYSLTVGENTITEFVDASSEEKLGDNWIYQYKFEDVDLLRNQELIFKLGGSPITISATTGDNCNARVEEDGEHVKHAYAQTTAKSNVYLKVYAENVYKIYVSNLDTNYYVIGDFNTWTTSAACRLESLGDGKYVARSISVTTGDKFKVFSAGIYYPEGLGNDLVVPAGKTGIYNMYLCPTGGCKEEGWDAGGYFYLAGVSSVAVTPDTVNITVGQNIGSSAITVSATFSDTYVKNNIPLSEVTFKDSGDHTIENIATYVFSAVGNKVITAYYGGQSAVFTVAVAAEAVHATGVEFVDAPTVLYIGDEATTISITITTASGKPTTDPTIWSAHDKNSESCTYVEIDQYGHVTPLAAGTAVIRVDVGEVHNEIEILVKEKVYQVYLGDAVNTATFQSVSSRAETGSDHAIYDLELTKDQYLIINYADQPLRVNSESDTNKYYKVPTTGYYVIYVNGSDIVYPNLQEFCLKVNDEIVVNPSKRNDPGSGNDATYDINLTKGQVFEIYEGGSALGFYHYDSGHVLDGNSFTAPRDGAYVFYINTDAHRVYHDEPVPVYSVKFNNETVSVASRTEDLGGNVAIYDLELIKDTELEYNILQAYKDGDLLTFYKAIDTKDTAQGTSYTVTESGYYILYIDSQYRLWVVHDEYYVGGSFNEWTLNNSSKMTYDATSHSYVLENVSIDAYGKFKVKQNVEGSTWYGYSSLNNNGYFRTYDGDNDNIANIHGAAVAYDIYFNPLTNRITPVLRSSKTLTIDVSNVSWWNNDSARTFIHCWDGDGDFTVWPGTQTTSTSTATTFTIVVPSSVTYVVVGRVDSKTTDLYNRSVNIELNSKTTISFTDDGKDGSGNLKNYTLS